MSPKKEQIWYKNPRTFIEDPLTFVPTSKMSLTQTLNAVVKLSLYISVIMYFMQKKEKGMFVLFSAVALTVFINYINVVEKDSYVYTQNVHKIRPTVDNPFMNPTIGEFHDSKPREIDSKAADIYEDPELKEEVEEAFDAKLHQNTSDIFSKYNSQRQFYTVPVTTIPNKQNDFAKWLYQPQGAGCKEGNIGKCTAFLSNNIV